MKIRDLARVIAYTEYYTRPWMSLQEKIAVVYKAENLNNGFMDPSQLKMTPEELWHKVGVNHPKSQACDHV